MSTDPRQIVLIIKFAVVLSLVMGLQVGLLIVGTWIGGKGLGIALMMLPWFEYPIRRLLGRKRVEPLPTARSLPPRRAT